MCAGPEHDVGKVEKVEEDEMWPNAACRPDPNLIVRKQMPDITHLADKHPNPINRHKDMVNRKWGWVSIALPKGGMPMVVVVVRRGIVVGRVIGVVNCGDKR